MSGELTTTSFLLSNLHCPSCVSHIKDTLSVLNPAPVSVSPSLLTSVVTIDHETSLPVHDLREALEEAGFDICDISGDSILPSNQSSLAKGKEYVGYLDRLIHSLPGDTTTPAKSKYPSRHIENCKVCQSDDKGQHDNNNHSKGLQSTVVENGDSSTMGADEREQTLVVVDSAQQDLLRASLAIGGMTCASCANTLTEELNKRDWIHRVAVNLISNSATVEFVGQDRKDEIVPTIEDIGYDAVVDSIVEINQNQNAPSQDRFRATLAVGGMTCASCVSTLTAELKKKNWIEDVTVNLISNSATIDFIGNEHRIDIIDAIEDIGYDATFDSVIKIQESEQEHSRKTLRTVEIYVDGMFCEHCPGKVVDLFKTWGNRVEIERSLTMRNPVIKISYTPDAPTFTIRNILRTISEAEDHFEPSIYHPPTLEERSRKILMREQLRILIRVILTVVIAIPTLIIGIVYMSLVSEHNPGRIFLMHPLRAGVSRAQWALFIMATPVYFLCADVFHVRALKEIRSMWRPGSKTPYLQRFLRFGSMNMLMSLGTSIAYISSTAQLISAGADHRKVPDESTFYFDSVVFLTLFLLIGRLIETYSKSKTGDAVTMLGKLRPTEALLVMAAEHESNSTGENITEDKDRQSEAINKVNVDLLDLGDVVKVLHGGSPPCDGIVTYGDTKFDESSLTGESRLVKKVIGDEVFSGTVNKGSPISIKITGAGGSSMLDQIVKAVREGQTRRAPIERIADALTSYFVPGVTLIAIITWVAWLSLGLSGTLPKHWLGENSGGWVAWSLQFAIAVFVVACPCGLALAAPTALFVGGGLAAKHGILVKGGGEAFEKASRLDCIVFDKTGTLTVGGEPVVTDSEILPVNSHPSGKDKSILGMVRSIEENSSHTVAKALVSYCKLNSAAIINSDQVEEISGKGMMGKFEDTIFVIGNELLIAEKSVSITPPMQGKLKSWKSEGKSVALAAINTSNSTQLDEKEDSIWHLAAIFAISDPVRPEAPPVIKGLQKRGTDVWMLSGDNQITANAIGAQVGIPAENIIAGVLPSQKAEKIQHLQKSLKARTSFGSEHASKRALIAMVGDGINDSPALTAADVGIAIGSGSDIAISSAEFVLVSSNLTSLLTLLDLSKFVFRRIKFNFAWALVYNMIALPVAGGVLYPVVSGGKHVRLDPVWASLAMAASSVSVVCSSLLLRSRVPWVGFQVREVEVEGE
ncbi:putative copper-transporting ATPase 3 [Amylocarpus encephaloides]|uniref:Copper-transporting ATPase 3 n=1 Tax=Amylocarpus encephaloides TaxID=45428 RepID=A0A9P7Y9P1_9HELO|nr:putative copper-transporting ATPase 3 [Amylocarpus encephaloides]